MTEQNIHLLWDSEVDNLIVDNVLEYLAKIEEASIEYPTANIIEVTTSVRQHLLDNGLNSDVPIEVHINEPLPLFLEEEPEAEYEDFSLEDDWDEALVDDEKWETDKAEDEALVSYETAVQEELDESNRALEVAWDEALIEDHDRMLALLAEGEAKEAQEELEADWDEALVDDAEWEAGQAEKASQLEELIADWDEALVDDAEWEANKEEEAARKEAYDKYEDVVNAQATPSLLNTRKAILSHLNGLNEKD